MTIYLYQHTHRWAPVFGNPTWHGERVYRCSVCGDQAVDVNR